LVVGQSLAGRAGVVADLAGIGLIGGSIFIPVWQRASLAASHDEDKREKLTALKRRLVACLAVAILAFVALSIILRAFPAGGSGVYLCFIPLSLLMGTVTVAVFTAISVRSLW
jgi:hypothetical protein